MSGACEKTCDAAKLGLAGFGSFIVLTKPDARECTLVVRCIDPSGMQKRGTLLRRSDAWTGEEGEHPSVGSLI